MALKSGDGGRGEDDVVAKDGWGDGERERVSVNYLNSIIYLNSVIYLMVISDGGRRHCGRRLLGGDGEGVLDVRGV